MRWEPKGEGKVAFLWESGGFATEHGSRRHGSRRVSFLEDCPLVPLRDTSRNQDSGNWKGARQVVATHLVLHRLCDVFPRFWDDVHLENPGFDGDP